MHTYQAQEKSLYPLVGHYNNLLWKRLQYNRKLLQDFTYQRHISSFWSVSTCWPTPTLYYSCQSSIVFHKKINTT